MQNEPVALVTGANKGIGLQIAKDLASHGFIVLVGSRSLPNGEEAAKAVGADARALQLDVTDPASIAAAAERVRTEFGRLDVLVNNAGISHAGEPGGPLTEIIAASAPSVASLDEVRAVFETNVFGVQAVTQAMLRKLLDRYRFRSAPYPRSSDLVDGFLSLARTPAERELALDQFHRITLYDLKAKRATVRRLANGRFESTVTVEASKSYSDSRGSERPAPFNQTVDIGLFAAHPGQNGFAREDVVSIQRMPIRSGEQQVRLVTRRRPVTAIRRTT